MANLPFLTADAAVPAVLAPVAGRFYGPPAGSLSTVSNLSGSGSQPLAATPIYLGVKATLTKLAFEVSTTSSTAFGVRLGVYADNAGQPGALVVDGGTATVAANGGGVQILALASAVVLLPGWYWATCQAQFVSPFPSFKAVQTGSPGTLVNSDLGGAFTQGAASSFAAGIVTSSGTFGALPAAFSNAGTIAYTSGNVPIVWFGF